MDSPLRVLLVEDSEDDSRIMERELCRHGFALQLLRVEEKTQFTSALKQPGWDLVITDHNLPCFSSDDVLKAVHDSGLDLPVIILSGTIGEDAAVAAMKSGANDYIMKGNLARLVPAIERELREAARRREHRKAEATIRHLAFHDPLTGLVNRHRFEQRLAEFLRDAQNRDVSHSLLYMDLDQFKVVNDTCGHVAGDELLKQVALLLQSNVREKDTVARLGGDEFGILLESCPLDRAEKIATNLLHAVNDYRFIWTGKSFAISSSIGLVGISAASTSLAELLGKADVACYAAKDLGRNRIHVFQTDDEELSRRQGEMHWVARINWALERDSFILYEQNIFSLTGNAAPGYCEVLLRLEDEDGNLVAPGAFLPAAERYNLAPAVDRWVVGRLLKLLEHSDRASAAHPVKFFVNISGATLNDVGFYEFVHAQLRETGVPAALLCFEITETAAIANLSRAVSFINSIRAEGCQFALDDFGAGLSSFSYLKALPVDFLKIDGGFVRDIAKDPLDRAIVEAINRIGHVLGLKTIAEFVEDEAIRETLCRMGVNYAQGFLEHRPEPLLLPVVLM